MKFTDLLKKRWIEHETLVCVGLDPYPEKFPSNIGRRSEDIFEFNKAIIDATQDLVCAYKPQFAHFAAVAAEDQLKRTIGYIKTKYPEIPVILDSKRGDIGSTAAMYAKEAFEHYQADSVTVNPYMGVDTVKPFTDHANKGTVLLCRTSNPGASELQNLETRDGLKLYEQVAKLAANTWNEHQNIMLVVGATAPDEMANIRKLTGDMPFLVPGIGAQGGDIEAVVAAGKTADGTGLVINSSRAILYASDSSDFADAARAETLKLKVAINAYR